MSFIWVGLCAYVLSFGVDVLSGVVFFCYGFLIDLIWVGGCLLCWVFIDDLLCVMGLCI